MVKRSRKSVEHCCVSPSFASTFALLQCNVVQVLAPSLVRNIAPALAALCFKEHLPQGKAWCSVKDTSKKRRRRRPEPARRGPQPIGEARSRLLQLGAAAAIGVHIKQHTAQAASPHT